MRDRFIFVAVVLSLLALTVALTGGVGATHGEPVHEDDIVEVRTVTDEDTGVGELRASYRYHVGDTARDLRVRILSDEEPVEVVGFEPTDEENTYTWDGTTEEPGFEFRLDANLSDPRQGGLQTVDTGEWAIIGEDALPRTELAPLVPESNSDDVETRWITRVPEGEGVAGDGYAYLGASDRVSVADGFDVVLTPAAGDVSPGTVEEMGEALVRSSETLDAEGAPPVTVFVVGDPLRRGGVTVGNDFWIHEADLPPAPVLWHEYVHTQQRYDRTADAEWTVEGSAEYLSLLFALRQGAIEYHEFHDRLERGGSYEDVVLADRGSWVGTTADYERGALTLAALDATLRERSDATYVDVFRAKNRQFGEEALTDGTFESLASDVAGTDVGPFFEEYVRNSSPIPAVPAPTAFDAPRDGARLTLDATAASEESGAVVEVGNAGSETSLAPTIVARGAGNATITLQSADGTEVTELVDGWVFDHLAPGESHSLVLGVDTAEPTADIDLAVEDVSGSAASTGTVVEVGDPVNVTLDVPVEVRSDRAVELVAEATADAERIDRFEFAISGPGGEETVDTADGRVTYTFEEPGTYLVDVTAVGVDGETATATAEVVVTGEADADATDESDADGESGASDDSDGEPGSADDTDGGTGPDDGDQDSETDADGPGFGVGAALVAIVGLLVVARNRR